MDAGSASDPSTGLDTAVSEPTSSSKTCMECGRTFTKAAHLLRHSRSHAQQKPFSCSKCDKAFARTDALQRHERTVHSTKRQRGDSFSLSESVDGSDYRRDERGGHSSYGAPPRLANPSFFGMGLTPSARPYERSPENSAVISPTTHWSAPEVSGGPSSAQQNGLCPSDYRTTYPPPSFFPGFPASGVPTDMAGLEQMLAQWLDQDGGAMVAESALAVVFADQNTTSHFDQIAHNGGVGHGQLDSAASASNGGEWNRSPEDCPSWSPTCPTYSADRKTSVSTDSNNMSSVAGNGTAVPVTRGRSPSPTRSPRSSCRKRNTVIAFDTWETGVSEQEERGADSTSRSDSPQPSKIISPDQVVNELHVKGFATSADSTDRTSVIPSMKFLDSCLHLYFRDFHPSFPVIHKPTFSRDRASPLLLLSMCSIGCMFVGTQGAKENGLWIYERLHYVVVVTRDSKMASEELRLAVNLSSLLGQCFSFLYGKPKQMLTADFFHGTLCAMARRNGLSRQIRENPISSKDVEHLDHYSLERRWRQWGRQETFRRVSLGLTIHAAELTAYTGLPRLMTAQLGKHADLGSFSDALFEADDAETWRAILMNTDPSRSASLSPALSSSSNPEVFLPMVLLAQSMVNLHMARELEKVHSDEQISLHGLSDFYRHMTDLARDHGFANMLADPRGTDTPGHQRFLSALFHYTCALRLTPMSLIEEGAGREGRPTKATMEAIKAWVDTPAARLATLHCGQLLHQASDLRDLGFILPRGIFQVTLLLYCYLSFVTPPSGPLEIVDVLRVTDWQRLVQLCANATDDSRPSPDYLSTPEERYVAFGTSSIHVHGFIDGKEKMLDIVSLRSSSNRLLRRCTPWGLADTLGDLLSSVSF